MINVGFWVLSFVEYPLLVFKLLLVKLIHASHIVFYLKINICYLA